MSVTVHNPLDAPLNLSKRGYDPPQQNFQNFQAGCTVWSTSSPSWENSSSSSSSTSSPSRLTPVTASSNLQSSGQLLWPFPLTPEEPLDASPLLERVLGYVHLSPVKHRGPKQAVPDEKKDERYFKRRCRNNAAAKRSRDARKERQSGQLRRIASIEKENNVLRAQLLSLRAEAEALSAMLKYRQLDLQTKTTEESCIIEAAEEVGTP